MCRWVLRCLVGSGLQRGGVGGAGRPIKLLRARARYTYTPAVYRARTRQIGKVWARARIIILRLIPKLPEAAFTGCAWNESSSLGGVYIYIYGYIRNSVAGVLLRQVGLYAPTPLDIIPGPSSPTPFITTIMAPKFNSTALPSTVLSIAIQRYVQGVCREQMSHRVVFRIVQDAPPSPPGLDFFSGKFIRAETSNSSKALSRVSGISTESFIFFIFIQRCYQEKYDRFFSKTTR